LFEETAWALAGSGVPFLWVLHCGFVHGGPGADAEEEVPPVPKELRERGGGRRVKMSTQKQSRAREAAAGSSRPYLGVKGTDSWAPPPPCLLLPSWTAT
jgi:hypothetical protein